MKKQVNKTIKLVCLMTALAAMVIATGCNNFLTPDEAGAKLAAGKGLVTISLGSPAARTLLPKLADLGIDSYSIDLTDTAAGTQTALAWDGTSPLELDAGSYSFTLTAMKGESAVATGASTNFTVSAGVSTPVTITLVFDPPAAGQEGTLDYVITNNITAPLDASDGITVVLRALSDGAKTPVGTDSLTGTKTDVPAGYYLVIATLSAGTQEAVKSDVVHIYQDLVTKFTWTFEDADLHAAEVYLSGTLTGGVSAGTVTVYADNPGTIVIGTVTLPKNSTTWEVGVPKSYIESEVYADIDFLGLKSALETVPVTADGADGVTLNLTPVIPQGVNAAPWYKTVTGSVANDSAARATDGSITTNWAIGGTATSATLTLAFDFDITVNAIVLRNSRTDTVSQFTIEYSANGTTWTPSYTYNLGGTTIPGSAVGATSGDVAYPVFLATPFNASYVRLSLGLSGSGRTAAIWEFELYDAFDRSQLIADITSANALVANTEVSVDGTDVYLADYWVTQDEQDLFTAAITAAKAIAENPAIATAQEITDAVDALADAHRRFNRADVRTLGSMNASKTALIAAITAATERRDYYKVSADSGATLYANQLWVTQANKTTYADAITAAETVRNDNSVGLTQSDVNNALATLNAATGVFTGGARPGALVNNLSDNLAPRYMKITATNENASAVYKVTSLADGNATTRWATGSVVEFPAYVTIDFGLPVDVNQSVIKAFGTAPNGRISDFEIEYWDGSAWRQAYDSPNKGTAIGGDTTGTSAPAVTSDFATVNATQFRLKINASNPDPTIWEWELYNKTNKTALITAIAGVVGPLDSNITNTGAGASIATDGYLGKISDGVPGAITVISAAGDGSDVNPNKYWITSTNQAAYEAAITAAQGVVDDINATQGTVDAALATLTSTVTPIRAFGTKPLAAITGVTDGDPVPLAQLRYLTASNRHNGANLSGKAAVDGSNSTRWATASSGYPNHAHWLTMEFNSIVRVDKAHLLSYGASGANGRITSFKIEYLEAGEWKTAYSYSGGQIVGAGTSAPGGSATGRVCTFDAPIEASIIRLNILSADSEPSLWEFKLLYKAP
ncbi:hypothetical protein AGMMS50267_07370 [Spirochaetia bacterium]|nr:hypothetical protein AGMMS50267_07370 [Spirochaetia bacterium]